MKFAGSSAGAVSAIRRRFDELLSYAYCLKKAPKRPGIHLLIFAQGRTGSTLLEDLLASTGHFHQHGELLNERFHGDRVRDPIRYFRGLARRKADRNITVHVKIEQLTKNRKRPVDPAQFLSELHDDGWSIVYLRRANKVEQALSNLIAVQRGHYHKYVDKDEEERFRLLINLDDFVYRVRMRISRENAERKALADIWYQEIIYEDDLRMSESQQSTVNRILGHFSLEPRKASTRLLKVNNQSLDDLIINYEEFVDCVTSHNWQEFLNLT